MNDDENSKLSFKSNAITITPVSGVTIPYNRLLYNQYIIIGSLWITLSTASTYSSLINANTKLATISQVKIYNSKIPAVRHDSYTSYSVGLFSIFDYDLRVDNNYDLPATNNSPWILHFAAIKDN